jgi:hypothetical protein
MDGRAAFASNAVEFVRMLPDNARLFVRSSRSDGKTKEANFNLGHLSDIRNKIAHACDWGRRIVPVPVEIGAAGAIG